MPDREHIAERPSRPRILVIVGPTAVGKTALSIELASSLGGEIVNADSRLFYRGMDIGTAKPTQDERAQVAHHLIDFLDPADPISLATVQDLAFTAIDDVAARGKLPILVGGTPQYVNAIVENWRIPHVAPNQELRTQLEREEQESPGTLFAQLQQVDPEAERHRGNTRRIIRALEVYAATGQPISALQGKDPPRYDALEIELWRPRAVLYQRIDNRAREQIDDGLVEEVASLLRAGIDPASPSFSSIGYRQLLPYIRGEVTLEDAIAHIQHDCHRLVRHQETWWRKNPRLVRIDLEQPDALTQLEQAINRLISW